MRINLLAGGFGGTIGALQNDVDRLYSNIEFTIEDLKDLKTKINNVSGGTGGLDAAVTGISNRIRTEETKKTNLETIAGKINTFLNNATQTDSTVSQTVRENQNQFFNDFPWLRPQNTNTEPSIWEQLAEAWGDFWGNVGEWVSDLVSNIVEFLKEHALEIIIGLVAIVIGAVLTWLTGGAFLAALLAGLKAAAISALISGTISGIIALLTGGDFWDAFGDGLASGFMWGGILSGISQLISGIMRISAQLGAKTIQFGNFKIWSPNSLNNPNSGGTLFKWGKTFRLDFEAYKQLFHTHIPYSVYDKLPQIIQGFKWIFDPAKRDVHVRLIPIIAPIISELTD